MFRDRTEKLLHLIKLYREISTTTDEKYSLREEIEQFCSIMIDNMIEDKDLDLKFANTLYEYDAQLFGSIFKAAIEKFYWTIGFNETFRMIGEVKYFYQALRGYGTIFDMIKDQLENYHEHSYNLREKLQQMSKMKDFDKLTDDQKSQIELMTNVLEPFSMLPKPRKSKRVGNWLQHFLILAQLENCWEEEKKQFYSIFSTET